MAWVFLTATTARYAKFGYLSSVQLTAILPNSRRAWKYCGGLYATACLTYYLATWYGYGGFDPGHPPLLDLEEFWAAAGTKFVFFG